MSTSGQVVGGVVGAVVGFFTPIGPLYGAQVGIMAGEFISLPDPTDEAQESEGDRQ